MTDEELGAEVAELVEDWKAVSGQIGPCLGAKADRGKERYDLIPPGVLCDLARVLTHGAAKYQPNNWLHVADPEARYYAAAMRHLEAWRMGAKVDLESQLPHLAHALCCVVFLAAFSSGEARARRPQPEPGR